MRNVWERYDSGDTGSKVFTDLITALKRLVTEKPSLLGSGTQMGGIGVQQDSGTSGAGNYGLDIGRVASATVSGVVGMIGSGGGGLSLQGSSMKLQWYGSDLSPPSFVNISQASISWTRQTPLLFQSRIFTC